MQQVRQVPGNVFLQRRFQREIIFLLGQSQGLLRRLSRFRKITALRISRRQYAQHKRIWARCSSIGLICKFHRLGSISRRCVRRCRQRPNRMCNVPLHSLIVRPQFECRLVLANCRVHLAFLKQGVGKIKMCRRIVRINFYGLLVLPDGLIQFHPAGEEPLQNCSATSHRIQSPRCLSRWEPSLAAMPRVPCGHSNKRDGSRPRWDRSTAIPACRREFP